MKKRIIFGVLLLVMALSCSVWISQAQSVYPVKTDVTLKYWMNPRTSATQTIKNFGETDFAKELAKRTGIKCQYIHPSVGQATETLNLMIASGDLPDIMEYKWFDFAGGPNLALKNGYILKLNTVINKYAPNLKKYLNKHSDIDKMVKTDDGSYYVFPRLRSKQLTTSGLILRKDWLNELGMKAPETIDEWYTVLKAFKEKCGAAAPLSLPKMTTFTSFNGSYMPLWISFSGAFNAYYDFHLDDRGKVTHGTMEPGWKEFIATMHKWYAEGLLDPNFATTNAKMVDSYILSGKSGAAYGAGGSGIGKWMQAMAEKDPKYDLVPVKYPASRKGTLPKYSQIAVAYGRDSSAGSAAISAKCKHADIAARLLDYGYSPAGHILFNFGIEGVSYKMVKGQPTYTDLVLKNPDHLSPSEVMTRYMRAHVDGPLIQDVRYLYQYYALPQQKQALDEWSKSRMYKYNLPPVTPSKERAEELSKIMYDVTTYSDEMVIKFIMGVEPLSNYSKYQAQIEKLGIKRAIAIMQEAVVNYKNRK